MSRMIKCCPNCGSAQIRKKRGSMGYRCGNCSNVFVVPADKEAKVDLAKMKLPPSLRKCVSNGD